MALDVETPTPPDLTNRGVPDGVDLSSMTGDVRDLRREELEQILQSGAWNEAFREWAAYTDLTESEYRAIGEHRLLERIDIYWDPVDERLRFELPEIPPDLNGPSTLPAKVNIELTDFGDTVIEMLEEVYADWADGETESWTEETFRDDPTGGV